MLQAGKRQFIPIDEITPDPDQPRVEFQPSALEDLAHDLWEKGQLQAINVRVNSGGGYVVITGERRLRAFHLNRERAKREGNKETERRFGVIEAVVRADLSPTEIFELQVSENQNREGFTDLERAIGFEKLVAMRMPSITRKALSAALKTLEKNGQLAADTKLAIEQALKVYRVSASTARKNLLPLIDMPEDIKTGVKEKAFGSAVARLLNRVENLIDRAALVEKIKGGLSISDLEKLIEPKRPPSKPAQPDPPSLETLQQVVKDIAKAPQALKAFDDDALQQHAPQLLEVRSLLATIGAIG